VTQEYLWLDIEAVQDLRLQKLTPSVNSSRKLYKFSIKSEVSLQNKPEYLGFKYRKQRTTETDSLNQDLSSCACIHEDRSLLLQLLSVTQ